MIRERLVETKEMAICDEQKRIGIAWSFDDDGVVIAYRKYDEDVVTKGCTLWRKLFQIQSSPS